MYRKERNLTIYETPAARPDDRMPPLNEAQSARLDELIEQLDADTLNEVIGEQFDQPGYVPLLAGCREQDATAAGSALVSLTREYVYSIHRAEIDDPALPAAPSGEYGVEKRLDDRERARDMNEVRA